MRTLLSLANSALGVAVEPGASLPVGGRNEPAGAVHRRGRARSIRRTSPTASSTTTPTARRSRSRSICRCASARAARLTLDDYMRAMWRVHGKPAAAARLRREAVHAGGRARAARGGVRRSRLRRRLLQPLHRGARSAGLRAAAGAGRRDGAASAIRAKRGPAPRSTRREGRGAARPGGRGDTPAFDAGLEHGDVLMSRRRQAVRGRRC